MLNDDSGDGFDDTVTLQRMAEGNTPVFDRKHQRHCGRQTATPINLGLMPYLLRTAPRTFCVESEPLLRSE